MSTSPLWARVLVGIISVGLLGYAAYRLFLQATGSLDGAVIVVAALIAWVVVYLTWGRKFAAKLKNNWTAPNPAKSAEKPK